MKKICILLLMLCLVLSSCGCSIFMDPDRYEPNFSDRLASVKQVELIYYDVSRVESFEEPVETPTDLYDFEKAETVEVLDPALVAEFLTALDTVKFYKHSAASRASTDKTPVSYCIRIVYATDEFDVLSFRFNSFFCRYDSEGSPLYVEADIRSYDELQRIQGIANRFFKTPM